MQCDTINSYLPTENYIRDGSLGGSNLIAIIVTPSQGTHAPHLQASEQRPSAGTSSSSHSIVSIIGQNTSDTVVSHCRRQDLGSTSERLDLPESMSATNTMLQNEATSGFGPVRTMAYAAHSSRIIYRRPEPRLIVMVPYISGNNYFSDGSLAIYFANGTSTYHVHLIPRNPFSYWIPAGMLTNTLAPVTHAPSFSVSLQYFSWNWNYSSFQVPSMYSMINHTPRFVGLNHGPGRMPLHPSNSHMAQNAMPQTFHVNVENMSYEGLLAFQDRVGSVTERSTSDTDMCCICLDEFSDGQIIGSADCQHTFHFDCISQWLMVKNSCPLCRRTALAI